MSAPPPYTQTVKSPGQIQGPTQTQMPRRNQTFASMEDSELSALKGYDIAYLVDDSTSMAWEESYSRIVPWPSARNALVAFSNLCSEWDPDGQDLYFINRQENYLNASPTQIAEAFDSVQPYGSTNMGRKLQQIALKYFENFDPINTKPLNIIAITDGEFTDDVESVIKWIVKKMDEKDALPNSFAVQFIQIGADPKAKKHLDYLDDKLDGLSRDIVDTVPWLERKVDGRGFDGRYLAKAVCGAINKRLDDDNMGLKGSSNRGEEKIRAPKKKKGFLRRLLA